MEQWNPIYQWAKKKKETQFYRQTVATNSVERRYFFPPIYPDEWKQTIFSRMIKPWEAIYFKKISLWEIFSSK